MVNSKMIAFLKSHVRATLLASTVVVVVVLFGFRVMQIKQQRNRMIFEPEEENLTMDDIYADPSFQDYKLQVKSILKIREKVRRINNDQSIVNDNYFGFVDRKTTVIVIQVHMKGLHLKMLLKSLEKVAGIVRALLIFSHDYYDEQINSIIENIDFVKYKQIFYPYNSQLYPNIFPGDDAKYCIGYNNCKKNRTIRNSSLAQKKHHWWWQLNYVFDELEETKYFGGFVVFLEEDHYVSEDFVYMYKLMGKVMPDECPMCDMMSLGAHLPLPHHYHVEEGRALIEPLGTTVSNLGITFNRTTWTKIKSLRQHFCEYDDYKWENSLRYLATRTAVGDFLMLTSVGPRVFHIGQCGLPVQSTECEMEERLKEVTSFLKMVRRGLYPRNFIIDDKGDGKFSQPPREGQFSDIRDRDLCMFLGSRMKLSFKYA